MKEITATDIEIISTGMRINFLEQELRENRDRLSHKELSEGGRKLKQQNLNSMVKRYKRLLKQSGKIDEYNAYKEMESQRRIDEEIERTRAYDDREEYLNSMGLEAYDIYQDEMAERM